MSHRTTNLQVARAEGPGAGRFLAVALADALEAPGALLSIQSSDERPEVGDHGLDFIFSSAPEEEEVIRVGLDRDDNVVSAELLRRPKRSRERTAGLPERLRSALRSGTSVAGLRWDGDSGADTLVVTMRRDRHFRIALD